MVNSLKRNMTSENIALRIITTYICFLIIFFTVTILSYYLLPQGVLLNKHPSSNLDISSDLVISTLQIFSYNLLSVIAIIFGNIFSTRKNNTQCFMPLGYLAFFVMIIINAIVLGTWSFSVVSNAIPLIDRIIRTFDLFHRAGLWEMSGQLFILCATAKISLIITDGKRTTKKNWKTIKFSKQELIIFGIGLMFMLLGAIIESYAIINFK
ncbi:MAG: hypothetical protein ABFC94_08890 [Syntrophomonas sp.]